MTYKVIRNAQGEAICFGPNEDFYQPIVKDGETLNIEADVPQPSAAELQSQANATARAYLASTDWMVLRQADSGEVMPNNIKDARAAARLEIKP